MKLSQSQIFFAQVLTVFFLSVMLAACGGGGGGDANPGGTGGTNTNTVPAGKVQVDGHIFNPDFFTVGKDFYVKLSYFDDAGQLISHHDVWEWQGSVATYSEDYRYTYDASGKRIEEELELTYTREGLALYTHAFTETTYTYNADNRLDTETAVVTRYDDDGDGDYNDADAGNTRHVITFSYDTSGKLVTEVKDDDGDGLALNSNDTTTSYEYDANDNLVKETITDYFPSTTIIVYDYDVSGNRTKKTVYPTVVTNDPTSITTYQYDSSGNLTEEAIDHGVAFTSDRVPDGTADEIVTYVYGTNGDLQEKITEEIHLTFSRIDKIKYLHEVVDDDANGIPDSTVTYVFWLDTEFDSGGGYPPELLPSWYNSAQTSLNNSDSNDGWGLNWEGHDTGTCSTCGNMIGQVNRILAGF